MKTVLTWCLVAGVDAALLRKQIPSNGEEIQAFQRVAAAEDMQRTRVLCRVGGDGDSVTVRLHPDNSRSLAFNDDTSGFETKVRCTGKADPKCAAQGVNVNVNSVDQCPECPCDGTKGDLFGPYSKLMAEEVDRRCGRAGGDGGPTRALLLGFGGGELAEHLADRCGEKLQLDAVELDGRLPQLAVKYFGLPGTVSVTVGDALPVSQQLKQAVDDDKLLAEQKRYDVIMVDCFAAGGETPEHCRNQDFLKTLHGLLRGGGRVLHHLWRRDPNHADVAPQHDATVALYKQEYACQGCKVEVRAIDDDSVDDMVVASIPASASSEDN